MNTPKLIKNVITVNSILIGTFFINITIVVYAGILGANLGDSSILFISFLPLFLAIDYFQFISLLLLLSIVFALNIILYRNLNDEANKSIMNLLEGDIILSTLGGVVLVVNASSYLLNFQLVHDTLYSIITLCGALSFLGPTLAWIGVYLFFITYYTMIHVTRSNELASLISLLFSLIVTIIPNLLVIKRIRWCYH